MKDTILVIGNGQLGDGMQKVCKSYAKSAGLPVLSMFFHCGLTYGCMRKKKKGDKLEIDPDKRSVFLRRLQDEIARYNPKVILICDPVALFYLTEKHTSLAVCRGSVYAINGIPAIVIDSLQTANNMFKVKAVDHFSWLYLLDMQKVARWYYGKQMRQPEFRLTIVETFESFTAMLSDNANAILVSLDTETTGAGAEAKIAVSGYSFLLPDGNVNTYVIPFCNPFKENGCQWTDAEFEYILLNLRKLHDMPTFKVLQNGSYDASYYIKYRLPTRNWIFDTAVLWHSIWALSPKRLDFLASIACDHYRYWKDEGKEDAKDDDDQGRLPKTPEGWQKYLRYNGFDTYYPIMILMYELNIVCQVPWAMENYRQTMRQTLGPAMAMSARGVRVDKNLQLAMERQAEDESATAMKSLLRMVGNADFNPNSPAQVATLIYDVLKATPLPVKGKKKSERSTNENDLELIRQQHWLIDKIVNKIWDVKKPKNNVSKFGTFRRRETGTGNETWNGLKLLSGRWTYKLSGAGTYTGRYASSKSNFWIGQQIQNPPYPIRAMVIPDPGYAIWRVDLAKADMFNTAFAANEKNMIDILMKEVRGEIDTHCYHASRFYSIDYDKVYQGYKNKEDWVVHSTEGCRQNAKRIVYGANYLMAGYTLLLQMGLDAVRATAKAMGYDTSKWQIRDFVVFCQNLIDFYFSTLYPELMPWLIRTTNYVSRHGKLATANGGRTCLFFSDPAADKAAQRELAAFYGQAGSAGTMNRALDKFYYEGYDSKECMVLWQMHDELGGQVRLDKLHLIGEIVELMEEKNYYNGMTFSIPAEAEVGLGWGYRTRGWHKDITVDELIEADEKWKMKNVKLLKYL